MSKYSHRPDTPPPKPRPPAERCEWVPIDFATNSWGLYCPWCKDVEPQSFPETGRAADEMREAFAREHLGCSGQFPTKRPKVPPP